MIDSGKIIYGETFIFIFTTIIFHAWICFVFQSNYGKIVYDHYHEIELGGVEEILGQLYNSLKRQIYAIFFLIVNDFWIELVRKIKILVSDN